MSKTSSEEPENKKDSVPAEEEKSKKVVVVEEVEDTPQEESEDKKGSVSAEEEETKDVEPKETDDEKSSSDEEEKEDDNSDVVSDDTTDEKPKTSKLLWIIVPTTLLVGALAGGVITYFSGVERNGTEPTTAPEATISPDVSPTSTPEPESTLKRADVKVQVLNGSGVAGSAGVARDFLEELGYEGVAVGNADTSDYETTTISVKKDMEDYLSLLKGDLKDEYTLSSETETLSASSSYDVVITLGAK